MKLSSYSAMRSRLWVRRYLNPLMERGSRMFSPTAWLQGREIVFQNMVNRDLDRLGINDPFYPLRSAATYSYLYLLLRAAQELGELRILELGAGQSTILIDRLAQRFPIQCTTLEHDEFWQQHIAGQVEVDVRHAPLVPRLSRGHQADSYDPAVIDAEARFNVLLVDGPRSSKRRSRWGCLAFIEQHLEDDFLIIIDDAERPGEIDTIGAALQLLDERGIQYGTHLSRSINSQFVIATEGLQGALFF